MTALQLHIANALYLALLVVVAITTRATSRRIAGAVAGAAAGGAMALGADAIGEELGWWRMAIWGAEILPLVYINLVVSCTPIFLISWRMARRFGRLGLTVVTVLLAVIGPPRDYAYMAKFPEWGAYAPGVVPVLAIAVIYAILVPLGHSVMFLIAGPASQDRLARRPWKTA